MKFNICIIKPENYEHSMAFWELAELLQYSLRDLNHTAEIQFNKTDSNARNIILGFHFLEIKFAKQVPKNTILVNLEQFLGNLQWPEHFHRNFLDWTKSFEIWDYSPQNIDAFKKIGLTNVKYLKIGYQKELTRIQKNVIQDIDVLFYGSINERRSRVLDAIKSHGLNVHVVYGSYGKARDDLIGKSKIVLNLHYYESQIFEVIRVFYLLCNSITVVGEINETTEVTEPFKNAISGVKYENLVETCAYLASNSELANEKAATAYEIFKQYPQKKYTEYLLEDLRS